MKKFIYILKPVSLGLIENVVLHLRRARVTEIVILVSCPILKTRSKNGKTDGKQLLVRLPF